MCTGRVTINILPDDVLLLIFRFDRLIFLDEPGPNGMWEALWSQPWGWHRLVHVCRRWRSLAFASPNFLDLRLFCGPNTNPELMGIWPPLQVIIRNIMFLPMPEHHHSNAEIVPHNRVYEIKLLITNPGWQRLALAMQEQFPALVHLVLCIAYIDSRHPKPILTDRFLGGSAPRLQSLITHSISFPTLPKFLLSATHLVRLDLRDIPHSGYMSPEAFVTGLAVSVNLESLCIKFQSHRSLPYQESRCQPPPTRTILPALTRIELKGVCEWLEDVVARIDVPLLDPAWITFFHPVIFDIPQLSRFIRRTAMFQAFDEAHLEIDFDSVHVGPLKVTEKHKNSSGFGISCEEMDQQLLSLVQVVASFFHLTYVVENVYIYGVEDLLHSWRDSTGNTQWLEILHPFMGVKNLYVCRGFARRIAPALRELVGERARDVLPALECLFVDFPELSEPLQEALGPFVSARQHSGHPVTLSRWIT